MENKGYTGEVTVKISIENGKIKIVNLDNNTQTINYDVKDYDGVSAWYVEDITGIIGEYLENCCT